MASPAHATDPPSSRSSGDRPVSPSPSQSDSDRSPSPDLPPVPPASDQHEARAPNEHAAPRAKTPGAYGARADRVLVAVCITAIAFFLLQILTFGYGRDQGIYAVVARTILQGGMPYRDVWDFKPPGIFLIFAAARALFGEAQYGIRVLEVLGLLAMIAGMTRLARDLWGDRLIGLTAGAVAAMAHAQLDFWHTAQPESFGGMLTIFALLLALSGERRRAAGEKRGAALAWIASGLLFGAAGLLKPPLAGGGAVAAAVIGLHIYRARRAKDAKDAENAKDAKDATDATDAEDAKDAKDAESPAPAPGAQPKKPWLAAIVPPLFIAAGGALPIALCLAWFAAKGALSHLYHVLFVFTPHYTALGWVGSNPIGMTYHGIAEWLTEYGSLMTVGLLILLAIRPARRETYGVALLLSVIGIHIVGVVMQGKFFPYHYGATWPVTAMLAGLGLYRVFERFGRRSPMYTALFFAGVVIVSFGRSSAKDVPGSFLRRCYQRAVAFTRSPRDQEAIDRLACVADVDAVTNRAAANFIRDRVPAGRLVFVWGFEPVIYDLADRPFSSPYIYNVPQRVTWDKASAREALMRDLAARPPAAIVVEKHDVFPMVTGDAIDSADTLKDFPALRDLLRDRYKLASTIDDLEIHLERP